MKSDLLPDPGLILIHSHIINNKVGGLRRIKGQRVSGITVQRKALHSIDIAVQDHIFRHLRRSAKVGASGFNAVYVKDVCSEKQKSQV